MALKLYQLDESTVQFTEISAGTFTDPVSFQVAPGGSALVKKIFLRNDDATKWYNDIIITTVANNGAAISDGSVDIRILSGDNYPSEAQWAATQANSAAQIASPLGAPLNETIPEIGAAGTADQKYYPFWVRVLVSKASPVGSSSFRLKVSFTENLV